MLDCRAAAAPLALAARAAYILRDNSSGAITKAAPALYPHQWSWDCAFNAVGLAAVNLSRARLELTSLLRGQWRTGMVPHIVFDPAADGYFPGPSHWDCARLSPDAPAGVATSGIIQPPVHALAVARILERAGGQGATELDRTTAWAAGLYPGLLAWHRFLARTRTDAGTGLITLYHGWESGMDNSPRWDVPYGNVRPGADLPVYTRRDLQHVTSASERPSDTEYDRYLWLVEEAKRACYDQELLRAASSFAVGDVLFTAIFAAACDTLAGLSGNLGGSYDGAEPELRSYAARARAAVLAHIDPATGLAADVDLRTGQWLRTETIAGFAPLIAGDIPAATRGQLTELLLGPRWAGHPKLRWPLPPSTSPCSPAFRPDTYWRGPVWPVTTWLLTWALSRGGEKQAAARLRAASLDQLGHGTFAEYYHPMTGGPLGSHNQSWTAAVALDWLVD